MDDLLSSYFTCEICGGTKALSSATPCTCPPNPDPWTGFVCDDCGTDDPRKCRHSTREVAALDAGDQMAHVVVYQITR